MARAAAPTEGRRANRRGAARLAAVQALYQMDLAATPRLARWLKRCLDRPAAREAGRLRAEADATVPVEVTRGIAQRNRL